MVQIKGHEFKQVVIRDSHNRRAQQYTNKILACLRIFGVTEDDAEIPLETVAIRRAQASVSWYMWNQHFFYSYNRGKFVENLAMVCQVIEYFVLQLRQEAITQEEFSALFEEDTDILKQREKAREVLGVDKDSTDFETMHKNYKELSKEHHPDKGGDLETFKKINNAHKLLKKELH